MSKPFDAALNGIIDELGPDWARFLAARCGIPAGAVSVLDTDLSATLQADRLFRIDGATPAALHLELESSGRLGIPEELLRYNVAARAVVNLPVHSVVLLLRPKATATDLTGQLDIGGANGAPYLTFRYTVIRLWLEPFAGVLNAGRGLAPLALLTNEAAGDLPTAFDGFRRWLRAEKLSDKLERLLLVTAYVLCGLRYTDAQIEELYRDLSMTLEDSTTYQLILNKGVKQGEALGEARGRVVEAQSLVLALAAQRFGAAGEATEAAVRAITDRDLLQRMALRASSAADWTDLLSTP